jgi:hypothetical protein
MAGRPCQYLAMTGWQFRVGGFSLCPPTILSRRWSDQSKRL